MSSEEHLSFDELAELAEDLLPRRRAAAARAHLERCAECATRATELEEVTARLRGLEPVTMPADVVERLDRALAEADTAAGETVVPDLGAVRRRRALVTRPIAAAAAVVVIAGVAVGIATSGHHKADQAALSPAQAPLVGTSAPPQLIQQESGQTYTPDSLPTLAVGLLSGDATRAAGIAGGGSAAGGTDNHAAPSVHPPAGAAPLAPVPGAAPTSAKSGSTQAYGALATTGAVPAPLRRYANSRTALLACAAYITDTPGAAPLAVDYARWTNAKAHLHNAPSLILVFADPDDASLLDVYVVAPACDSAALRDFTEVPRNG